MIKKIAELSRDKRTYFGCLVQDYVSFLQENKECHVSSTDMLQTIRQFMTQVKNYLSQSSELDPPIESLIPEDQIGKKHCPVFWGEGENVESVFISDSLCPVQKGGANLASRA